MSAGAERIIPLRFVHVLPCTPDPVLCPDNASWDAIGLSVQTANQVFKSTGIQFWVRSVERYQMLYVASYIDDSDLLPWSTVDYEFAQVFPSMPMDAWVSISKSARLWIHATAAVFSPEQRNPRVGRRGRQR
jgi:hypothetical protein